MVWSREFGRHDVGARRDRHEADHRAHGGAHAGRFAPIFPLGKASKLQSIDVMFVTHVKSFPCDFFARR